MRCKLKTPMLEFVQWRGQPIEELPEWAKRSGVRPYLRYKGAPQRLLVNDNFEHFDRSDQESVPMNGYLLKDEYSGYIRCVDKSYFEECYEVIQDEVQA